jgi:colanic acid biosynthesis glycosyl transferase WcaI
MPGTMTRLSRVRTVAGGLRLTSRNGRSAGGLSGRRVALVGADPSPHVTGFGDFATALMELVVERAGQVIRPLQFPSTEPPELVIAALPGPGAAGAAAELAAHHDVPLLLIVQGETLPLTHDAGTSGARLAARLERHALKRADRWAVTGEVARRRLLRLGVDSTRIDSLPYWAPPVRSGAAVESERAMVRRFFGWPAGFLVVCPVGADTAGLVAVVSAAHQLAAQGSDVQFVLVGRGPRLSALSASAADVLNVTVAEVSNQEYSRALFAADLVLLTEAAGRPDGASAGRLAAGMAAGRPMIAALADGDELSTELARAAPALVTVPADRPRELADTIDVLRSAPHALTVMAAGAQQYTRIDLGPETAAATLEEIAARTLSRSSGSSWWGRTR